MAVATSFTPSIGGPPPTSSKAPATASTTADFDTTTTASSRPSDPTRITSSSQTHRHPARPTSSDFLSDKATAALIRRILCAHHLADRGRSSPVPIHDLLPPLTSRNDVDLQLYALISIIIREFVQNWYSKITPDDTFVAEIVQIIAHCTRALEQRLRKVDLESLLFDELPELLAAHVRAYRIATTPIAKPPLRVDLHNIYHSLCPLPALSPVPRPGDQKSAQAQADNESAYRQLLVQGVLAVLLPTEDLKNDCLTSFVGQIFSELVIGNIVVAKVSEPWFIWEVLIMITRLIRKKSTSNDSATVFDEAAAVQDSNPDNNAILKDRRSWSFHQTFWSFVHWVFLVVGVIRLAISAVVLSMSLPSRSHPRTGRIMASTNYDTQQKESQFLSHEDETHKKPVRPPLIDFHIWPCIGDVLEMELRMPWLRGALSMMQWICMKGPGRLAGFDGTLDRLLSHYIHIHVLDPAHLPPLLRAIRAAVFPNNAPGVPSLKPPSSDEQLAALRRRCASALWGLVPRGVGKLYYGTSSWAWSGVEANIITNRSASLRTGPLNNSNSSTLNYNNVDNVSGHTGEGTPHVRLLGESKPEMRKDATLSSRPKAHLQEPNSHDRAGLGSGDEDEARILFEAETGIVDIFSDAYCNKHLLYGVLELVLVRLIPELAEKGIGELWGERLT